MSSRQTGDKKLSQLSDLISKCEQDTIKASDRRRFPKQWAEIADEYGVCDLTVGFLYDGLAISQAEPFACYLQQTKDEAACKSLFEVSRTQKNDDGEGLRLFMSLLACEMLKKADVVDLDYIADCVISLAADVQLDEEFRLSLIRDQIVMTLMRGSKDLIISGDARISPEHASLIREILGDTLDKYYKQRLRNASKHGQAAMRFKTWLDKCAKGTPQDGGSHEKEAEPSGVAQEASPQEAAGNESAELEMKPVAEEKEGKEPAGDSKTPGTTAKAPDTNARQDKAASSNESAAKPRNQRTPPQRSTPKRSLDIDGFDSVLSYLDAYRTEHEKIVKEHEAFKKKYLELYRKFDTLDKERTELKQQLDKKDNALESLRETNERQRLMIEQQATRIGELQEQCAQLTGMVDEREQQLEGTRNQVSMVELQHSADLDAYKNELAGSLSGEYETFCKGSSRDMTPAIGAMMRSTLGNVFDVLESAGIDLKRGL